MKIGVVLPIGEDEAGNAPSYRSIRELALQAEADGLDSLWVPDHLIFRLPPQPTFGIWEGWSIITALAEATSRVELGPLVMCVPFRNPALLAKMAITVDEISGGRLILGLGAGWHQPEFAAFGYPFERLATQFEEGLQIITPLLREGRVDFSGTYFRALDCEMRPRGPRPGGPPTLVAARGPRMLHLTAQYADQWNAAWYGRPTRFHAHRAAMQQACVAVGRDPASLGITIGLYIIYPQHLTPEQLAEYPASYSDPERAMRGTTEEIAAVLRDWRALDVDHLIVNLIPSIPETFAELAAAVRLARDA